MNERRIKDILQKVRALAERGVGGERESAQAKLEELLKKYGLSEQEVLGTNDSVQTQQFVYHGKWEKKILLQCMYATFRTKEFEREIYVPVGCGRRTIFFYDCTDVQKLHIDAMFEFYKTLFEKDLETFWMAFIHKHSLFGDDTSYADTSNEEIHRIRMMMAGMCNDHYKTQIKTKPLSIERKMSEC